MNSAAAISEERAEHLGCALEVYAEAEAMRADAIRLVAFALAYWKEMTGRINAMGLPPRLEPYAFEPRPEDGRAIEEAVLGGLIRGSLRPSDVDGLENRFTDVRGPLSDVVLAAIDIMAKRGRGSRGVPTPFLFQVMAASRRVYPWIGYLRGYVLDIARRAPGRKAALDAVMQLRGEGPSSV